MDITSCKFYLFMNKLHVVHKTENTILYYKKLRQYICIFYGMYKKFNL